MTKNNPLVAPVSRREALTVVSTVILSNSITLIAFFMMGPLIASRLSEAGFSQTMMGVQATFWSVGIIACGRFYPKILLKLGALPAIFLALSFCAATDLLYIFIPAGMVWLAISFAAGAAYGLFWVVSESWLSAVMPDSYRARILAFYAMSVGIGASGGPLVLSLVGNQGYLPFLVAVVLLFVGLLPYLLLINSHPRVELPPKTTFRTLVRGAALVVVLGIVSGFVDSSLPAMFTVYVLKSGHEWSVLVSALTALGLGRLLLQLPMGYLADHFERRLVLGLAAVFCAAVALSLPLIIGTKLQPILLFLWGGSIDAFYVIALAIIGQRYRGDRLTEINILLVMTHSIGSFFGSPLIGVTMDWFGAVAYSWTVAAVVSVAVVAVTISLISQRRGAKA
ncbi:MAG: MFS transporter [Candidatus Pacebacteria bacterium]|nr:MFS transporter [Candidatus Paceibacterota bacterium]